MTESPTGWYQDDEDPTLARWWDGERWTEHTISLGDEMADADADPFDWSPEEERIDEPEDYQNLPREDLFPDLEETLVAPQPPARTRFPRPIEGLPLPAGVTAAGAVADDAATQEVGVGAEDPTAAFAGLAGLAALRDEEALPFGSSNPVWTDAPPAHRRSEGFEGGFAERMARWPLGGGVGAGVLALLVVVALAVGGYVIFHHSSSSKTDATSTSSSSTTTQVTFIPLGQGLTPPSSVDTTTTAPSDSTSTTAAGGTTPTTRRTTTTTVHTTTTTAHVTTTTAVSTTTTTTPTTTTTMETTTTAGGTGGPTTGG